MMQHAAAALFALSVAHLWSAHAFENSTCNAKADDEWGKGKLHLQTCSGPNTQTLLQVVGGTKKLKKLAKQFDLTPLTAEQADCMVHSTEHPVVSQNLRSCVPLIAPPANASEQEKRMASMGITWEDGIENGTLVSMCKPGQPCKEFNKFLGNGSLEVLAKHCGVLLPLLRLVKSRQFIEGAYLGYKMQNSGSGPTDNCFCTRPDSGEGVRGPMFGPIYWVNAVLVYFVGGLDLLGRMPGCRALCPAASNCVPSSLDH